MAQTQPIPYLNDDEQNPLNLFAQSGPNPLIAAAKKTMATPPDQPPAGADTPIRMLGDDPSDPLAEFKMAQLPNVTPSKHLGDLEDRESYDRGQLQKLDTPYKYSDHGFLRNLGHVAAGIGNVAGDILDPGATALIPHSYLNNNLTRNHLNSDLADVNTERQTDLKDFDADQQSKALTDYTKQRPDIAYAGMDTKRGIADDKLTGQYGLKRNPATGNLEEDPTSQAYKSRVALQTLHQATADKDKINAEIAQNHYVAGTPEYDEAQRKLAQVDKRLGVAMAGLGLRAEGLELRKENNAAQNTGIDPETGKPFVGAGQIVDSQGNVSTVGSRFAPGATAAQSGAGQYNDVHGALDNVEHVAEALAAKNGGSLNTPGVVAALTQAHDTGGKWIPGSISNFLRGENAASLTPEERNYVQSVQAAHENMQGLRKSAGGGTTDSQVDRLESMIPDATTPDLDYLKGQTGQIRSTADRLAPGVASVAGGLTVRNKGQQHSTQQPPPEPKVGDVVDGYKYKGGGPHDQKNWEKVSK